MLIYFSPAAYSQGDTAQIRLVFNYLHTDAFRTALKDSNDKWTERSIRYFEAIRKRASEYRKQQKDEIAFWIDTNRCFSPESFYFIPDKDSRVIFPRDSLLYRTFEKRSFEITYQPRPSIICHESARLEIYLLSDHIIEVSKFFGQLLSKIKFGKSSSLRFYIKPDATVILLQLGGIYYN